MPERLTFRGWVSLVSMALMEAAWLAVLAGVLFPPLMAWPLYGLILVGTGLVLALALVARRLLLSSLSERVLRAVWVVVPLVLYLGLLAAFPPADAPFPSLGWAGRAVIRPLYVLRPGRELGALALVGLLWWRALAVAQPPRLLSLLAFRFRVEVLALLAGIVFFTAQGGEGTGWSVWAFFQGSLMTLSLARVDALGDLSGARSREFDRLWVATVAGSTALILGLSALMARLITAEGTWRAMAALGPVLRGAYRLFSLVVVAMGWVFARIIAFLVGLLAADLEVTPNTSPLVSPVPGQEPPPRPAPVTLPWLEWVVGHLEVVLGVAVMAVVVVLLVRQVRRRVWQRRPVEVEVETVGDTGEVARDVAAGVRGLWTRLKDAVHLLRRYGVGTQFLAALSVHNIYVNMLRWAAAQNIPRRHAETPYEHLARLEGAFPQLAAEMRLITHAFVAARYGDLAVDEAMLAQLRAAWERIRSGGREGAE